MNIVLIGYRASGKTTVGKTLAARLGWQYVDIDSGIVGRCGKTIAEIFAEDGESHYRDVESRVVAESCGGNQCVIAMGGGSVMREENRQYATRDSLVVYLEAPARVLWRRMSHDPDTAKNRPNLSSKGGLEEVVEMLALRGPVYSQCANLTLDASLPVEILVERILENLSKSNPSDPGSRLPDRNSQGRTTEGSDAG